MLLVVLCISTTTLALNPSGVPPPNAIIFSTDAVANAKRPWLKAEILHTCDVEPKISTMGNT
jgi:hypothetical protein